MKFLEGVEPIIFKEKEHQYFTPQGQELISASTLVHEYSPPFDPTGSILINKAEKLGISPEELRKQWDYERDSACERGTQFHKEAEYWVENRKVAPANKYKGQYRDVIKQLKQITFKGTPITETVVYSVRLGLAGTIDLLDMYDTNKADIKDWKTNKALKFKSFFKRGLGYQKMLPPVGHLLDCNFVHYSLQLAIYEILMEENGYWINDKTLYYINPKTRIVEHHKVLPLRKEAMKIINHFNINK